MTGVRLPTTGENARGLPTGAVLDATALDARGVSTLADALEMLPGVTTADELGAPAQPRCHTPRLQVSPTIGLPQGITVTGRRTRNEPDANEVTSTSCPRGPGAGRGVVRSLVCGRNSLGAAVNLVTRRPCPAPKKSSCGRQLRPYEVKANAGDRWHLDHYIACATNTRMAGARRR